MLNIGHKEGASPYDDAPELVSIAVWRNYLKGGPQIESQVGQSHGGGPPPKM